MTTVEVISQGEASLQREGSLIKDCLKKRINGEDDKELISQLERASNVSNQLLGEYYTRQEMVFPSTLFGEAMDTIITYSNIRTTEAKLKENYSLEKDLKCRTDKIAFAYDYILPQELAKRLIWCLKEEEQTSDTEETINGFMRNRNRILPLRDFLLEHGLKVTMDKDDLRLVDNKPMLIALMNMNITHQVFQSARAIGIAQYKEEDLEKIVPAIFLNLAITISTHLDLAAQYGIQQEDLTSLDTMQKVMTDALINIPNIEEHPEIFEEINHVLEHATEISKKYNNKKEK